MTRNYAGSLPMLSDKGLYARLESLWRAAFRPLDASGLAAFRIAFGVLLCAIAVRTITSGWIERFYEDPHFFFRYPYFEWIQTPSVQTVYALYCVLAVSGALVSAGFFYRLASLIYCLIFTYIELIDSTRYLNHYYLVSLLTLLLAWLPLNRYAALDATLRPRIQSPTLHAWVTWLLRFQVGVVYVFAALAKATPDWLLHAQPLQIWLGSRLDTPVFGSLLGYLETAYFMSWAGFLYDLTIPFWLSFRATRLPAYLVVLGFHSMTLVFFDIGMFPFIMSIAAWVFFHPSWPRAVRSLLTRLAGAKKTAESGSPPDWHAPRRSWSSLLALGGIGIWCSANLLIPLRPHVYPGNLLWHEQGTRWAWRVLCREKNGSVTYRVRAASWRNEREVSPRRYLTRDQEMLFAAQPEMILQLAHRIRDDYVARGERAVEVRVDAYASLNGRAVTRLIDPNVDLAQTELSWAPAEWILPAPEGPPARIARSIFQPGDLH